MRAERAEQESAQVAVDTKHPDYLDREDEWQMMRHFERGPKAVREAREKYLPMPSGFKISPTAGREEYDAYVSRADVPDVLGPTLRGMVGLIHRTPFEIEGLEEGSPLAPLLESATRDGLTLDAFSQRVTGELLLMGRYAILPDLPPAEEGGAEVPWLAGYAAETIVNWSENRDLYVLDESDRRRSDTDEFSWNAHKRYRVLRLAPEPDDEGNLPEREPEVQAGPGEPSPATVEEMAEAGELVYSQQIYDQDSGLEVGEAVVVPTIRGGESLTEIPLVVVGPRDLAVEPEMPPLIGVARAVLRAYQLDADYRLQMFMSAQETLFVSGIDKKDLPTVLGALVSVALPAEGRAEYVGPSGTSIELHKAAIDAAKQDAIVAGAQLFDTTDVPDESGRARKLRYAAQTATLTTIAKASAAALERALRYCALFVGQDPEEIVVKPNLEFVDSEMTPQEAQALMAVWQGGGISYETYYENLRRGRIASEERTAQEEQDLIDQETPDAALAGGDLGGDEELSGEGPGPGGERFVETGEGLEIEEGDEEIQVSDEEIAALFAPEVVSG